MPAEGKGKVLDQFANGDNPRAHIETTGPELWDQTDGQITHFVSAMGTTGTIMGVGSYLHSRNKAIQIVGAQPRSEEHTSELQSLMRISYAVFCLKNKNNTNTQQHNTKQ